MISMIEWANTNSGFLLVILTAVYVSATLAISLIMTWSNLLSKKNIEQTARLENSRLRPYLSLSLKVVKTRKDGNQMALPFGYLVLANTGITQARNISIKMAPKIYSEPSIKGKKMKISPFFIEHPTPYLAPQEKISDSIGYLANIYDQFEKPIFGGFIIYYDRNKFKYSEEFVLDFNAMRFATPYEDEYK